MDWIFDNFPKLLGVMLFLGIVYMLVEEMLTSKS